MDNAHRFDLRRVFDGFQQGIQNLPKDGFRKIRLSASLVSAHARRRVMSVVFLALSGIFGVWAHGLAQRDAIQGWLTGHVPSVRLVQTVLSVEGFEPVLNSKRMHAVIRSIPTHLDDQGSVWISDDSRWVVYFWLSDEVIQPHVFSRDRIAPPASSPVWVSLGVGWEAFEGLLERIRKFPSQSNFLRGSVKKVSWKDPRAVNY